MVVVVVIIVESLARPADSESWRRVEELEKGTGHRPGSLILIICASPNRETFTSLRRYCKYSTPILKSFHSSCRPPPPPIQNYSREGSPESELLRTNGNFIVPSADLHY